MTEMPERIWAGKYGTTWWQSRPHHQMTEYLRADTAILRAEADAMVAAGYLDVASFLDAAANDWDEDGPSREADAIRAEALEIRRRTPADARAAFEQAVQEAVEAERASWEPVADALWQLLDDMGPDGQCVCLAAKEEAKAAYMGKVNGLFPDTLDVLPAAIRAPQEPKK